MKYLSDYTDQPISEALKKFGAFFTFTSKGFDEQKKEGVKYVNLGSGLICPAKHAHDLITTVNKVMEDGQKQDLKDHGKEAIIRRELYNHEYEASGDITPVIGQLKGYGITREDIEKGARQFRQNVVS